MKNISMKNRVYMILVLLLVLFLIFISFSLAIDEHGKKSYVYVASHPTVINVDGFQLIDIKGNEQLLLDRELVLPFAKQELIFPEGVFVEGPFIDEFREPEEFKANIPEWSEDLGYIKRTCEKNKHNASLTSIHTEINNKLHYIVTVKPVEVIDCDKGLFKLYKEIVYHFEYEIKTPVLIESVDVPKSVRKNSNVVINYSLIKVGNDKLSGKVVVTDMFDNILKSENIEFITGTKQLMFNINNSNSVDYLLKIISDDHSVLSMKKFKLEIIDTNLFIELPDEVLSGESIPVSVHINNINEHNLNATIIAELKSLLSNYPVSRNEKTVVATTGENIIEIVLGTDPEGTPPGLYTVYLHAVLNGDMFTDTRSIDILSEEEYKEYSKTNQKKDYTILGIIITITLCLILAFISLKFLKKNRT
ncbi:hypothetical protein DRJ17_04980 [Candidatus Woesearchaeota archaeon]|nr:MAG: hypothetical protein DRJ17_04980 [Candidatus Woesearchaeota archaeon]